MKELLTKLLRASRSITHIEKSGRNKEQSYNYVTDADVSHAVRTACYAEGVVVIATGSEILSSVEITSKHGTKGERVTVAVMVEFMDSETGQALPVKSLGCGFDYGDKAVAKALTGAVKYALLKALCLPTGDDPEGDEETDRNPSVAQQAPKPAARPAAKPAPAAVTQEHRDLKKLLDESAEVIGMTAVDVWKRIQAWCKSNMKIQPAKITDLNPVQIQRIAKAIGDGLLDGDGSLEAAVAAASEGGGAEEGSAARE